MRKFIVPAVCCILASTTFAHTPCRAPARPPALAGDIAIDYNLLGGGVWHHIYTIESFDPSTGAFSGTGHIIPDPSFTEIITGTVRGNQVTFHILYTGANPNYTVDAMGTIDDNGHLSGLAVSPGQGFTWTGIPTPR